MGEVNIDPLQCGYTQHRQGITFFCVLNKGHKPNHRFEFRDKNGAEYKFPPFPPRKKD